MTPTTPNPDIRSLVVGRPHYRMVTLSREAVNVEARTVQLSFASENPVERYWGIEILSHDPAHVRLDRWKNKPPFLENHRTRRGVIEDGNVLDRQLVGQARLSRNAGAAELLNDIEDGIAVHTSVGYVVHALHELKPEEMSAEVKAMCLAGGLKAYRCEWEPLEGSSVDIPADISVGLGKRSLDYYDLEDISDVSKVIAAVRSFDSNHAAAPQQVGGASTPPSTPQGVRVMDDPKKTDLSQEEILKQERARVSGIEALAKRFATKIPNIAELRDKAVNDGMTLERFNGAIVDAMAGSSESVFTPDSKVGLNEKELKSYSLLRAIQAQIKGSKVDDGFEREVSDEIAKAIGKPAKGRYVPWEVQNRRMTVPAHERAAMRELALRHGFRYAARDLTVAGSGTGLELVGTDLVASSFIELLRNKSVAGRVGVQTLFGMVGNFSLPRQTSAGTFYWVGETGTTTESTLGTGDLDFSPHEGAAYQEYSRMLLLQSTPSVEMLVQNDLLNVARLGIDAAVFHGSAAANQPRGIANESGIGAVTAADIGWEAIVEFETDVMVGNADSASMFYVTNPAVRGYLKTRPIFANSPYPIMGADGLVNGYPSVISNQINSGCMFFGDFSHELLAYWGNLDILVNPYSLDTTRHTRVSIAVDVDCRLRQAGAISYASDVS